MPPDDFEDRIQALLDGRPLPDHDAAESAPALEPFVVIDALARAHRTALFGIDLPPDRPLARWGHLEIRGEIGRGASGTVYRAWDTRLMREVALKLLDPTTQTIDEALDEGRLLARLNHLHIVRVFGADSQDGVAGVWMELLEGDTLESALTRDGVCSADEAILIGLDLARAVSAVHAAGLLHRDIKARNVLRERGGRIVLTDLGAGRTAIAVPRSGEEAGTPMYMAPEVLAGGTATPRSDIYSLGILLYRLLTGAYPVVAQGVEELRAAHATGTQIALPDRRPDVSTEIAATIERCCHPDVETRYSSATEVETALQAAWQRSRPRTKQVASPITRAMAQWRRTALAALGGFAALLILLFGGWETSVGRTTRRNLGLVVPPRSPLYLTTNGGLWIFGRGELRLERNPGTALAIAASSDLGIATMASVPPWTAGARFDLDGAPLSAAPSVNPPLCCFGDGTTDGRHNYAARQDSTMLEPIGSRPLAPPALYRFERDWTNPRVLFPLAPEGSYGGVAYSAFSQSFWLTRKVASDAVIEQWSREGRLLSTPVRLPTTVLGGIAVDPRDGTLWVIRPSAGISRLENFDTSGRRLTSIDVLPPHPFVGASGAEFAWLSR